MIIKIRDKINFDVVVEHRSTTVLRWIYYGMYGKEFIGDIFKIHSWGISISSNKDYRSFIIKRNSIDRFYDGFTAFTTRILKQNIDINVFVEKIYEWQHHAHFNVYLEPINYDNKIIINYNDKIKLINIIQDAYKFLLPSHMLNYYDQKKYVTNQVLTKNSIKIIDHFYNSCS